MKKTKECSTCGIVKDLVTGFYARKGYAGGYERWCKACRNKHTTENFRKSRFKMTFEDYQKKVEEQNGLCAICGNPPGKKSLAVDHCHKTGQIRGLLCGGCNIGIGHLKDSIELLKKALAYLEKYEAQQVTQTIHGTQSSQENDQDAGTRPSSPPTHH